LTCEKTRLFLADSGGRVGLERLGEFETIACDTVVFAIGDSIEPSLGLPLEPTYTNEFAVVPEPWDEYPERPRYMVYDPLAREPLWGTFVVGWARRASDGLVGKARADAVQGCDEILAFLNGEFSVAPSEPDDFGEIKARLDSFFRERRLAIVDYAGVQKLEEAERKEAKARGLEEFKFAATNEMLERLAE
ncbi:MAG: hypothetical protein ACNA8W_26785, partial [Bradymonadaceae bacterium]